MLHGDFSFIDDTGGYVRNPAMADLGMHLRSLYFQNIVFSLSYNIFGNANPVPLHIHSLVFHIVDIIIVFFVLKELFGKKTAFLASAIAAVHPINTEAVSWISGRIYLYNAFCIYLIMYFYIRYKKTQQNKHLITAGIVLTLMIIFLRGFYVMIAVLAVGVLDIFFFRKKNLQLFLLKIGACALVVFAITGAILYPQISDRIAMMSSLDFINQQDLKPVIQSYPYTLSTMLRLYIFPKDLTVYYDGNPITTFDYFSMYSVFFLYIAAVIWLWIRKREYAGILVLLPIFLIQAFSPLPISWYMAERYLYFGTPFFAVILVVLLQKLENRAHIKYLAYILVGMLVIVYGYRTVKRNNDWVSPKILAIATIATSPDTPRPYIDLGSAYYLAGDFDTARKFYLKALQINSRSANAKSSLGELYLTTGLSKAFYKDALNPPDKEKSIEAFNQAVSVYSDTNIHDSVYFLTESIRLDQTFAQAHDSLGDMFLRTGRFKFAEKEYNRVLELNPQSDAAYMKLGFIQLQLKNYQAARDLESQALVINPNNPEAKVHIETLNRLQNN